MMNMIVLFSLKNLNLPGVNKFSDTQVCIPNGWWLTENELKHIVDVVNKF